MTTMIARMAAAAALLLLATGPPALAANGENSPIPRASATFDAPGEVDTYAMHLDQVEPDCAADRSTSCRIKEGVPRTKFFTWNADIDWLAADLVKGRRYHLDITAKPTGIIAVRDARGRVLATSGEGHPLDFRATRTGAHFVEVRRGEDSGGAYTLTMDRR